MLLFFYCCYGDYKQKFPNNHCSKPPTCCICMTIIFLKRIHRGSGLYFDSSSVRSRHRNKESLFHSHYRYSLKSRVLNMAVICKLFLVIYISKTLKKILSLYFQSINLMTNFIMYRYMYNFIFNHH